MKSVLAVLTAVLLTFSPQVVRGEDNVEQNVQHAPVIENEYPAPGTPGYFQDNQYNREQEIENERWRQDNEQFWQDFSQPTYDAFPAETAPYEYYGEAGE